MPSSSSKNLFLGVFEALIAVFIFSLTMPTMHLALRHFDATVVGIGRMVIAAIPSFIMLMVIGFPRLQFRQILSLIVIVGCLVFGFSWLIALALREVSSHHAGIVIGGIPLATAFFATLRSGQRQSPLFWIAAFLGSTIVVAYGLVKAGGHFTSADLLLLLAAFVCGLAYAEASRLGQAIGTRAITCLIPVTAAPLAIYFCMGKMPSDLGAIPLSSWLALLYNGLFSTFIGFFFWYRGLAIGGIARIGQIQLLQPFFTLAASALMLGETLTLLDWFTAVGVVACVAATQTVSRRAEGPTEYLE